MVIAGNTTMNHLLLGLHADPIRRTRNYDENLFLRTVEGNPIIDKAYKMALAVA